MLHIDQTHLPPVRKYKAAPADSIITVHVTDVQGGFGVLKSAVNRWQARIGEHMVREYNAPRVSSGVLDARLFALCERYKGLPYHRITSHAGDEILNHEFGLRTPHGNGGNRGVGWAIDVGRSEALNSAQISGGRVTLRRLILDVLDFVSDPGHVLVLPHRAFSPRRLPDPGPIVWRDIVRPVVDEFPARTVRIDYHYAEAGGRPVPLSWDPDAKYDDRGRVIHDRIT
jgi:hypothetical protein